MRLRLKTRSQLELLERLFDSTREDVLSMRYFEPKRIKLITNALTRAKTLLWESLSSSIEFEDESHDDIPNEEKIRVASERVEELKRELEKIKSRIAQVRTREYPMMLERARLLCGESKREMAIARDLVEHYEPEPFGTVGSKDKHDKVHGEEELLNRMKKWRERMGELRVQVDQVKENVTSASKSLGDAVYVAQKIVMERKPVEVQESAKVRPGDPGPPKSLHDALARDVN